MERLPPNQLHFDLLVSAMVYVMVCVGRLLVLCMHIFIAIRCISFVLISNLAGWRRTKAQPVHIFVGIRRMLRLNINGWLIGQVQFAGSRAAVSGADSVAVLFIGGLRENLFADRHQLESFNVFFLAVDFVHIANFPEKKMKNILNVVGGLQISYKCYSFCHFNIKHSENCLFSAEIYRICPAVVIMRCRCVVITVVGNAADVTVSTDNVAGWPPISEVIISCD